MPRNNHAIIGDLLQVLREGLAPFVAHAIQKATQSKSIDPRILADFMNSNQLSDKSITDWDVAPLFKLIFTGDIWFPVFHEKLDSKIRYRVRSLSSELREVRNDWAHQGHFSDDDTYRAVDSAKRLLEAISAPQAQEIEQLRKDLVQSFYTQQKSDEDTDRTPTPMNRPTQTRSERVQRDINPDIRATQDFTRPSDEAFELRKSGDFKNALAIYRTLWQEHANQFNEWQLWSYAKCAQKCNEHEEAEKIARICVEETSPDFQPGRVLLAWCFYYKYFQNELSDGQDISDSHWKAAEDIKALCANEPYSRYAPFIRTVFKLIKMIRSQMKTEETVQQQLHWLGYLDPQELDNRPRKFRGRGMASDREKWYAQMSRVQLDAGNYTACIQVCEQALNEFQELHHGNDTWLRMRIADSKVNLGDQEEALEIYKRLVEIKPEWFLNCRLAVLSYRMKQYDNALRFASEAALTRHLRYAFAWELFQYFAEILRERGQEDMSRRHTALAVRLRNQKGWSIGDNLRTLCEKLDIDPYDNGSPTVLIEELRSHWKKWRTTGLTRHEGIIANIPPGKSFGFIETDTLHENIFFRFSDFKGSKKYIVIGVRVAFIVKESFDAIKNRKSLRAIEIEPLDKDNAEIFTRYEGTIASLPQGKPFGFLKIDRRRDSVFFLVRNFKGPEDHLVKGRQVTFRIVDSYDIKKEKKSIEAVDIEPVE